MELDELMEANGEKLTVTKSLAMSERMLQDLEDLRNNGFKVNEWIRKLIQKNLPAAKSYVKKHANKAA